MFGMSAYGAMKAAADHLVKDFALEFATRGIRFNSVAAGTVRTNAFEHFGGDDEGKKKLEAAFSELHAMQRIGEPYEAGELLAFLLSTKASFITGTVIPLDGGMNVGHMGVKGLAAFAPINQPERFWFANKRSPKAANKKEL